MRKMRPRGESISVPSSENVGQEARQSPQWTHWLTPSTESPWSVSAIRPFRSRPRALDAGDEAAGVQHVLRVELGFDPPHDAAGRARVVPDGELRLHGERRPLERLRLPPAARPGQTRELRALPVHLLLEPIEPHDEDRAGRRGDRGSPCAERSGRVEELDRVRDQVAGHDGLDRRARILQAIEADAHQALLVREWSELECRLDDDPEGAVGADEELWQVVARDVLDHLA